VKTSKTCRGFSYIEFKDRYGESCSLQKSSLATENCIWFGIDDPDPKIMASLASDFGFETSETTGWVKYPIPEEVLISTRMHLSQDQVRGLLPVLQKFVDTGEI